MHFTVCNDTSIKNKIKLEASIKNTHPLNFLIAGSFLPFMCHSDVTFLEGFPDHPVYSSSPPDIFLFMALLLLIFLVCDAYLLIFPIRMQTTSWEGPHISHWKYSAVFPGPGILIGI